MSRQKRDYITESHALGKSYSSMSKETGLSIYALKHGHVPYEVSRNIYRRSAYSYAKSHGLSTEEASLIRRGHYGGKKLSSVEDIMHGRIKTLDIKESISWADKTANFMRDKWNKDNEAKYNQRKEKLQSMSDLERKAYVDSFTKRWGYSPYRKPHKYSDQEIRKILSNKLGDFSEEEWEYKLTQT